MLVSYESIKAEMAYRRERVARAQELAAVLGRIRRRRRGGRRRTWRRRNG